MCLIASKWSPKIRAGSVNYSRGEIAGALQSHWRELCKSNEYFACGKLKCGLEPGKVQLMDGSPAKYLPSLSAPVEGETLAWVSE